MDSKIEWTVPTLIQYMKRASENQPALERPKFLRDLFITNAINGDESFANDFLSNLFFQVAHDKLGVSDRAALCVVLFRILDSKTGQKIACGVEKRPGQSRRGRIGLRVAHEVSRQIVSGKTAENAWEIVGETMHMTSSAVKQHWIAWKPKYIASVKDIIRDLVPEGTTEAELDALSRFYSLGARAAGPADTAVYEQVKHRTEMNDGQSSLPSD